MSNNCLVTKLKGTVDNPELNVLGGITIKVNSTDSSQFSNQRVITLGVTNDGPVTISVVGNGFIKSGENGTPTQKIVIPAGTSGTTPVYFSSGQYIIRVVEKYNVRYIILNKEGLDRLISLSDFEYSAGITAVRGTAFEGDIASLPKNNMSIMTDFEGGVEGELSELAKFTDLITLSVGTSSIKGGDISVLGTLTKLAGNVTFPTHMFGSIESFVAAQRTNGRTVASGLDLRAVTADWTITFNGEVIPAAISNTLSWTADTITFRGETINA